MFELLFFLAILFFGYSKSGKILWDLIVLYVIGYLVYLAFREYFNIWYLIIPALLIVILFIFGREKDPVPEDSLVYTLAYMIHQNKKYKNK